MTDFDTWNADQPCGRSEDAVNRLKAQWVQFEREGFDESEITILMDGWVKSQQEAALRLLSRLGQEWDNSPMIQEEGG